MIKMTNVENKEMVKEALMVAMERFNINQYGIFNSDTIEVFEFENQDRNKSLILLNTSYFNSEEDISRLNDELHDFYNNTYGTGSQCYNKSKMIKDICKDMTSGTDITIDSTTLVSFMYVLNPFMASTLGRMSDFLYCVYGYYMRMTR